MKKLLFSIFFLLLLIPASLFSQSHLIEYGYDDSGNRIYKNVIYLRQKSVDPIAQNSDSNSFKESLGEYLVSVFPNPTEGEIAVEIENFDSHLDASIFIFSENGKIVSEGQKLKQSNVFDLADRPSGVYFLKIISKEEAKTWKIIKL